MTRRTFEAETPLQALILEQALLLARQLEQTFRTVWSQVRRPQNSSRCSAAQANDQLAPARLSSLRACGVT